MDKKAFAILGALLAAYLGYQWFYFIPRQREWLERQQKIAREKKEKEQAANGVGTPTTTSTAQPGTASPTAPTPPPPVPEVAAAPEVTVDFGTPEHAIKLSSKGATLTELTFKNVRESAYKPKLHGKSDRRETALYQPLHAYHESARSLAISPGDPALAWVRSRSWTHEPLPGGAQRFWIDLPDGLRLIKEFHPSPPQPAPAEGEQRRVSFGWHFDLVVKVENRTQEARSFSYELWSPVGIVNQDAGRSYGSQVLMAAADGRDVTLETEWVSELQDPNEDVLKLDTRAGNGGISYFGVGTHYFAAVVVPDPKTRPVRTVEADSIVRRFDAETIQKLGGPAKLKGDDGLALQGFVRGLVPDRPIPPGQTLEDRYMVYVGPRQKAVFEEEGGPYHGYGLELLVDFGWFESLARILLSLLFGLHALLGNWGISIIFLTFVVRGLILPLSIWSQKNMLRMQRLAPEINSLKEKFTKKDGSMTPEQQRAFSAAQMDLFRKHGVNPVGCVGPIFLQIPIFVGLYNALNSSVELRQTPFFGWIQDLSVPEVAFRLPFDLPILGTNAFSILPLVMIGTYLLQHAITPVPTDPRAAEQHRIMRFMFPVFGLLMYTMPSGLMIYFITSSLWSIGEMKTVRRWIEKADKEEQAKKAAGAVASQFPGLR